MDAHTIFRWGMARAVGVALQVSFLAVGSTGADQLRFQWPLDVASALTSTFGEYRDGRFHTGIDLTTWGRTGIPVLAAGDGEVYRARASGIGYGRALYIRLDSDGVVVYGHLEDWSGELSRYVRREQERLERYEVDLFPPPGTFRVARGDVIGYTGDSGAGGPHLHFEVRSAAGDVAVNPLVAGYGVTDRRAPLIRDLTIAPAEPSARVAGAFRPVTLQLDEIYPRRYRAPPTRVSGAMLLSAHLFDETEGKDLPLAVYRVALAVDDTLRYEAVFDSIRFDEQREADLVYDLARAQAGTPRVRHLFRSRGSRIGVHRVGDGVLDDLDPGSHEVLLSVQDVYGNESSARLHLVVSEPPVIESWSLETDGDSTLALVQVRDPEGSAVSVHARPLGGAAGESRRMRPVASRWFACRVPRGTAWVVRAVDSDSVASAPCVVGLRDDSDSSAPVVGTAVSVHAGILDIRLGTDRPLVGVPSVWVENARDGAPPVVVPLTPDTSVVRLAADRLQGRVGLIVRAIPLVGQPFEGRFSLDVHAVQPGEVVTITWPGVALDLADRSLYAPSFVWAEQHQSDESLKASLTRVSSVVSLRPRDLAFNERATLWMDPFSWEATDRVGIFTYDDRKDRWFMLDGQVDSTRVGASISRLGWFCLMRDTEPPIVTRTRPARGERLGERRPEIAVGLEDTGAGLHWTGLDLYLDARRMIAEWDPEAGELRTRPAVPLAKGSHAVRVIATDRLGNKMEDTFTFETAGP